VKFVINHLILKALELDGNCLYRQKILRSAAAGLIETAFLNIEQFTNW